MDPQDPRYLMTFGQAASGPRSLALEARGAKYRVWGGWSEAGAKKQPSLASRCMGAGWRDWPRPACLVYKLAVGTKD